MTVLIRPYTQADKAVCLAIFESNIPDFFDASERDMLSSFLAVPEGQYFVTTQNKTVLGCGGFVKEDRGQARFTWGMVHRQHHGTGLGRSLAEYRLQEIEASGLYCEAELFTTPKVAPFFEKFGFKQVRVEKDGYAPNLDRVQMIKTLS